MPPRKMVADATIESEIADAVHRIYHGPQELTVNAVREAVEKKLKLGEGFLKDGDWKAKSKELVMDTLAKIESDEAEPSQAAPAKPNAKKSSKSNAKAKAPAKKRAKKEATPSEESESELSDPEDSEEEEFDHDSEEEPTKKRKAAKATGKKRKGSSDDDDDEEEAEESESERPKKRAKPAAKAINDKPTKKTAAAKKKVEESDAESLLSEIDEAGLEDKDESSELSDAMDVNTPNDADTKDEVKKAGKEMKLASDDESELSEVIDEPPKRKAKPKKGAFKDSSETKPTNAPPADKDDSESSMSEVFDEPPKRGGGKGRGKSKETASSSTSKGRKAKSVSADLSPDELLIKQLQSQLLKCGIRKIWPIELKKYGDDTKAKIRHLKNMLTEVGMTGRFSESKAKEIKMRRELEAELDAVKDGEKSWGLGDGGRPRRRAAAKVKSLKLESDSEDEEEDDESGDGEDKKEQKEKKKTKKKAEKEGSGDEDGDDDDEVEEDDEEDDEDEDEDDSEDAEPKARVRGPAKHRADFAFLGSESESD